MGTFFELGKDKAAKVKDGLCLSSAVPKIQWNSNPHCPYGHKAMRNFYLLPCLEPYVGKYALRGINLTVRICRSYFWGSSDTETVKYRNEDLSL